MKVKLPLASPRTYSRCHVATLREKKRDFVPRECDILLSWDDFVLAFLLIRSLHPKPAVLKLKKKVSASCWRWNCYNGQKWKGSRTEGEAESPRRRRDFLPALQVQAVACLVSLNSQTLSERWRISSNTASIINTDVFSSFIPTIIPSVNCDVGHHPTVVTQRQFSNICFRHCAVQLQMFAIVRCEEIIIVILLWFDLKSLIQTCKQFYYQQKTSEHVFKRI